MKGFQYPQYSATQPFVVSSRNAPPHKGGALCDDTKNGYVAEYIPLGEGGKERSMVYDVFPFPALDPNTKMKILSAKRSYPGFLGVESSDVKFRVPKLSLSKRA